MVKLIGSADGRGHGWVGCARASWPVRVPPAVCEATMRSSGMGPEQLAREVTAHAVTVGAEAREVDVVRGSSKSSRVLCARCTLASEAPCASSGRLAGVSSTACVYIGRDHDEAPGHHLLAPWPRSTEVSDLPYHG